MFRSSRAVHLASKTGEPLPHVPFLQSLYEQDYEIYRGSLLMIAGMPGSGKSMMALNLVHHMNLPALYFSADSDAATQISRLAAMTTKINSASIRTHLDDAAQHDRFRDALTPSNIHWVFDANPETYDIQDEISAYVELYDSFPALVVIDNLRNVYTGGSHDSEHAGYKAIQQSLIEISRQTGACVITMHHMKEGANRKSTDPAPRHAIDGMVAQLPAQIFSVAREGDEFRLCVVKDRENKNYPEAEEQYWHRMRTDATTSQFYALPTVQAMANEFSPYMRPDYEQVAF